MTIKTTNDVHAAKDIKNAGEVCLLVFRSPWSGPCNVYRDTLEDYSRGRRVPVILADIEDCALLAKAHAVKAVPLTVVVRKGKTIRSAKGALTAEMLDTLLAQ